MLPAIKFIGYVTINTWAQAQTHIHTDNSRHEQSVEKEAYDRHHLPSLLFSRFDYLSINYR